MINKNNMQNKYKWQIAYFDKKYNLPAVMPLLANSIVQAQKWIDATKSDRKINFVMEKVYIKSYNTFYFV